MSNTIKLISRVVPILLFCILCLNCNNEQKTADTDNAPIIETVKTEFHQLAPIDPPQIGSMEVELKLNDPGLTNPLSAVTDAEGNLYVLDYKHCELNKFSPAGKFMKRAGRKGNGPGEFVFPKELEWVDTKLYAFDYQSSKVNIFDMNLNFIEQKKYTELSFPFSCTLNGDRHFVITSAAMQMSLKHNFFVFELNGKLEGMYQKSEDTSKEIKGKKFVMPFPYLVNFDSRQKNLWAAGVADYEILLLDKQFNTIKRLHSGIKFKFKDQDVAHGQYKTKAPKDKGVFLEVSDGKIIYGFRYNNELYVDIIDESMNVRRFKSAQASRILCIIDDNCLLVSLSDDEEASAAIVKLKGKNG